MPQRNKQYVNCTVYALRSIFWFGFKCKIKLKIFLFKIKLFWCLSQNAIFAKIFINKYSIIRPLSFSNLRLSVWHGPINALIQFLNLKRLNSMRKQFITQWVNNFTLRLSVWHGHLCTYSCGKITESKCTPRWYEHESSVVNKLSLRWWVGWSFVNVEMKPF